MPNFSSVLGFLDGLAPAPRINISEWADTYRYMTTDISPFPGKYRTATTPYLKKIMDTLSPYETYEEVVFKKSSQVGATQAGNNWIGSIIHLYNGPALMVLPTEMLAKRNSKTSIDSMIESTPVLRERIASSRDRDSGNTVLEKKFPGGFLALTWAGSANSARSTSFRYIYLDELSAFDVDMGKEGDPYDLFVGRSKAFGTKRKIFSTSTPTTEGSCRISSLYKETDQQKYHIACPVCKSRQVLQFENLRWAPGDYDSVWYECITNGCRILERHKPKMLANGEWIATVPSKSSGKKIGFHINALYTPLGMYSWAQMAEDYDKAMAADNKTQKLKTFTNTMLGETWSEGGDVPDHDALQTRAETSPYIDGKPPTEVAILTAGVDIQKNRIEVEVRGWGTNHSMYSVEYMVLEGATDQEEVWEKLRVYLDSDFPRIDGSFMKIKYSCIDSGYLTQKVYDFCDKFGSTRCCPVKGSDSQITILSQPKPANIVKNGVKSGTTMIRTIGVSLVKELIYSNLKLIVNKETGDIPSGYCWFPKTRNVYYYKGLCSEVNRMVGGRRAWVKIVDRNEPLDLAVYSYCAGYIEGIQRKPDEWFIDQIAKYVPERKEFTQNPPMIRKKSTWLQ